jgi:hypothetical protein
VTKKMTPEEVEWQALCRLYQIKLSKQKRPTFRNKWSRNIYITIVFLSWFYFTYINIKNAPNESFVIILIQSLAGLLAIALIVLLFYYLICWILDLLSNLLLKR